MTRPLVLVVEDDATVRDMIAGLLEGAGYDVLTARDGLEGLVRLEMRRPALVVLDIMMPNVEGGRMLDEVREDPRLAGVPIVIVSGRHGLHEEFDDVVGRDSVFTKPFDPDALVRRVEELIGAGGGA